MLITFYYLGAIVMPLLIWQFISWMRRRFSVVDDGVQIKKSMLNETLSLKQRVLFLIFFMFLFVMAELFWRMLFEFLIAYLQIRDALVQPML